MPFTLSHTAVVLPFSRYLARWRLLSACLIGAMVPDFRVFLPWHLQRLETHSIAALFTFCLPVGLLTFWLFQLLLKSPVIEVLPDGAYGRWRAFQAPAQLGNPLHWLLAAIGILAGAVSHLAWDAFTHEGARGVRMLPMLDDPILELGRHHWAGYRLLQDGSSLLGLMALAAMILYGARRGRTPPVPNRVLSRTERHYWGAAYIGVALALGAAFFAVSYLLDPKFSVTAIANELAIAGLRGPAVALITVSVALRLRLRSLGKQGFRD
jgi:hypothetical protein